MNKEMQELAQAEYLRLYNLWLMSEPDKETIYNSHAKIEKFILKHKKKQSSNCPLKRVDCMGGNCTAHYKCQNGDHYHLRGSNKKEEK